MIHSDFDTNASREDILVDSERNVALLDWIAKAFVRAAKQFSEQDDTLLSYEWPLFLPTTEGESDRFWSHLDRKIHEGIKSTPLFRSRHWIIRRELPKLCILPSDAQMEDGSPVLEDAAEDIYLSPRYSAEVRSKLRQPAYGLKTLSRDKFLALLRRDIAHFGSKMRMKDPKSEWHSVVAKLILKIGKSGRRIDNIELLPLQNGTWITATDKPIYLPTLGGFSIPEGLNLQVLDPSSVAVDARRELFKWLGATEASLNTVRSSILEGFMNTTSSDPLNHLRFLYQTSPPEMKLYVQEPEGSFMSIYVPGPNQLKLWPSLSDVYLLKESDPYGPHALLSDCDAITVTYADPILLRDPPPRPSEKHKTWEEWLHGCIGIRSHLRLLNLSNTELSETSRYVLSQKPSVFLGLLEYLWKDLPTTLRRNDNLRQHIGDLDASSICNFEDELALQQCWFPLASLRETVEQYMENPAAFPFLHIEGQNDSFNEIPRKWAFLCSDFQVSKDNDLSFLLDILRYIYTDGGNDLYGSDDSNSEKSYHPENWVNWVNYEEYEESEEFDGSEYSYNSDTSGGPDQLSTVQLQKLCNLYTGILAQLLLKDTAEERNKLMSVKSPRSLIAI